MLTHPPTLTSSSTRQSHPRFELFEDDIVREEALGVVAEGYDLVEQRAVEILLVKTDTFASNERQQAFWRAAKAAKDLQSPHLLRVYDIDEARAWVVLEPISSVWNATRSESVDAPQIRRALRQFASGLEALHLAGFVHGAISEDSLCRSRQGTWLLRCLSPTQFGQNAPFGNVPESPCTAPELDEDPRPTAASDMYALGVAFLSGVAGDKLPALAGTSGLMGQQSWTKFRKTSREWASATKRLAVVSEDVGRVINKMIRKHSSDRYGKAEALLDDLGADPTTSSGCGDLQPGGVQAGGNVDLHQSPFHPGFLPLEPQEQEVETRFEKLLSPDRVYSWARKPMGIALVAAVLMGAYLISRPRVAPVPRHPLTLEFIDAADGSPVKVVSFVLRGSNGLEIPRSSAFLSAKWDEIPEGEYTVTADSEGFEQTEDTFDVPTAGGVRTILLRKKAKPPLEPITIPITPVLVGADKQKPPRVEVLEFRDGSWHHVRFDDFTGAEVTLQPMTTVRLKAIADGFMETEFEASYDSYVESDFRELTPVLEPIPRKWIIQVPRISPQDAPARVSINGSAINRLEQGSQTTDTFEYTIPKNGGNYAVEVLRTGFLPKRDEIAVAKGQEDYVSFLDLKALPRPDAFRRGIRTRTPKVQVRVESIESGAPVGIGVSPMTLALPHGRYRVSLVFGNREKTFEVNFHRFKYSVELPF